MDTDKPGTKEPDSHITFPYDSASLIQSIAELVDKLAPITDLDEFVERAVRLIQQTLAYDQVSLYLLDPEQQHFSQKVTASANQRQPVRNYLLRDEISLALPAAQYNHIIRIGNLPEDAADYYQSEPLDIRAELYIPMERAGNMVGVLTFGSLTPHQFGEHDVVLSLKMLATQLALNIQRIRQQHKAASASDSGTWTGVNLLHSSPEKDNVELERLVPGIQALADIRQVLNRIVRGVVDGLGYTASMLAVLDEANQTLPLQAIAVNPFIQQLNLVERIEEATGFKIIGKSASLIHDQGNLGVQSCLSGEAKISHNLYDLLQPAVNSHLSSWIQRISRVKTCVSLPLTVGDKVVGNLYAGTKKNEISEKDLHELRIFVTNAAIAIQNAMLYEQLSQQLTQREAELSQLRGIEKLINSSLDLREVLQRILNGALELTRAEYGQVVLAGKYGSDLVRRVSYPETSDPAAESGSGLTQSIIRDRKPKLIDNAELLIREKKELESLVEGSGGPYAKLKSRLGVPISLGEELIGVINIGSQQPGAFDDQSLTMLEQIAVQAAIAIRNAYQFKMARQMQERMANVSQVVAMGDLASNMVHSINNWVGSIRADLHYLKRQQTANKLDEATLTELLDDMLVNAETTLSMAENIRKPFQSFAPEPVDINACILSVLREVDDRLKNVFVLQELRDLPPVMATQQLELVFENLFNNALQAMEGQKQGGLRISTRTSGDRQWVEVYIQDSGPGLSPSVNEIDIFKLGVSGKKNKGLGYGLWWCDTFLKRWGGDIQLVRSGPKGCEFLVRLPVYQKSD